MYVIHQEEVIGFSQWPWDQAYTPTVGLFAGGRLVAHALCDGMRPEYMPEVSRALLARVRRKLTGVRVRPVPIDLAGPDTPCWFRLTPAADLLDRIRNSDRTVYLARLEDGVRLHTPGETATPRPVDGRRTVEDILDRDPDIDQPRDGFPYFAQTPRTHQLDIAFIDLLRRLPDPDARASYLPQLEHGQITLTDLRRMVMASEEFQKRRIGPNDRIGATMTSPLWREIVQWESPGTDRRSAQIFDLAAHTEEKDEAFIETVYRIFLRRGSDPDGRAHYLHMLNTQGRRDVVDELARWSASNGRHFEII